MPGFDLAAAAAGLYAAEPDGFIATRTRLAADARTAGDADAAKALGSCAKPVLAAAAVNALAREHADEVRALLALGVRLRAAQRAVDGPALRTATEERRRAVESLAAATGSSPTSRERVAATLTAAVVDADAALAVASGRLVQTLEGDGLDPVDTTDAVALPDLPPLLEVPDAQASSPVPSPAKPARDAAADRRRAQRIEAAERAASHAAAAAESAARAADERRRDADSARRAVVTAEERLRAANDALTAAQAALTEAGSAARDADRAHREARRAADEAARG